MTVAVSGGYGTVVSARDVSIGYRAPRSRERHLAVRGISFDLFDQEVLGIIGDAGSGKSTLAKALAGIAGEGAPEISGGSLTVFDTELRGMSRRTRRRIGLEVGYLSQDGAQELESKLTVAENVAEPIFLRDRSFNVREAGQAVATLVDAVHLPLSVLGRRPFELSSGQRQRVALARALILEPRLLVADEPVRGVDVTVREDVLGVIPELQASRALSALIVSSELAVLARVAGRVAVVHEGVVVGIGPLDTLFATPEHPYLKALARAVHDPLPVASDDPHPDEGHPHVT